MTTPYQQPPSSLSGDGHAGLRERLQSAVGERYRIERRLGEGGMAVVFLAEDTKHHRPVAIKVLQDQLAHTIGIQRFLQEIEVIARLQHPHLLTLIDSGDMSGLPWYVMPYVEGNSLREVIDSAPRMDTHRAVTLACEVAEGLQFAHEHGVIHRDIKPSNILMSSGHALVADFGIATALEKAAVGRLTETGISMGSPTYMSPEQASGERDLDPRTDVYSLGCVLYEMLCGEPPIDGASMQHVVTRKLTGRFAAVRERRRDVPPELEAAIHRAMATEREERFATMTDFLAALRASVAGRSAAGRKAWVAAMAAALVVIAVGAAWYTRQQRVLTATRRIAEVEQLTSEGKFVAAFALADELSRVIPGDTALRRLTPKFADFVRIVTVPAGARVLRQRLDVADAPWEMIGTTPLDSVPMAKRGWDVSYQLRIEHDGYEPASVLPNLLSPVAEWRGVRAWDTLKLVPVASAYAGMAWMPAFTVRDTVHPGGGTLRLGEYFIDRFETTNRDFKRFVDAGGYSKREYWNEPFVRDGRTLTWEEGIALLRDATGLPGPSTWSGGTFPAGKDDHPVAGVSYHEAAAYARFVGKRLPTATHWFNAANRHLREAGTVYMPVANLGGASTRPVGQGRINSAGLYDVAGNVREWCVNLVDDGRVTRGGGYDAEDYHTGHLVALADFDRSPTNGFRLVSVTDHDTTLAHISGRIYRRPPRDYSRVAPVSDREFEFFRRLYEYDRAPLDPRKEMSGVTPHFRWEKVSFTGPSGERMAAYMFLPLDATPPHAAVVLWPGSNALNTNVFDVAGSFYSSLIGFMPRSGRALVMPLFLGTWERDDSVFSISGAPPNGSARERDLTILWHQELRRTLDYLESRPDIRAGEFGFYGISWGGREGGIALAIDPRWRAAVLNVGGLGPNSYSLPEVDPVNFLARIRTPTLMLNGRHDVVFPYASSQVPFFRMLGTPAADKKHVAYPAMHFIPQQELVRESLAWFDKYLPR